MRRNEHPQCKCCQSEHRLAIDEALVKGVSQRRIAELYDVSQASVNRHRAHIKQKLRRAAARAALTEDSLLADVLSLRAAAVRLLQKAEANQSFTGAAALVGQAHSLTKTLGQAIGFLTPDGQVNVNVAVLSSSDEWHQLRAKIMAALEEFPEAREAVISALSGDAPRLPSGEGIVDAEVVEDDG